MTDPLCVECGPATGNTTKNNYGGWFACDLCYHEIIVQPMQEVLQ